MILAASLNYSGFCINKFKYISKEEKIRQLFYYYNSNKTAFVEINGNPSKRLKKANRYANFEQFIALHPNCCHVSRIPPFGDWAPPLGFIVRVTGYYSSVVWMEFDDKFIDENGNIVVGKVTYGDSLTNCGESRY